MVASGCKGILVARLSWLAKPLARKGAHPPNERHSKRFDGRMNTPNALHGRSSCPVCEQGRGFDSLCTSAARTSQAIEASRRKPRSVPEIVIGGEQFQTSNIPTHEQQLWEPGQVAAKFASVCSNTEPCGADTPGR